MAEKTIFPIGDDRNNLKLVKIENSNTISEMVETINANFQNIASHGGGPKGDTGDTGKDGPMGPRGFIGPKGETGENGKDGLDGLDGSGYSIVLSNPIASIPCGDDWSAGDDNSNVQYAETTVSLYYNSKKVSPDNFHIDGDSGGCFEVKKTGESEEWKIIFNPTSNNQFHFEEGKPYSYEFTITCIYSNDEIQGTWNLIPIKGLVKYELMLSTIVVNRKRWDTDEKFYYIPQRFTANTKITGGNVDDPSLKIYYKAFNELENPVFETYGSDWEEIKRNDKTGLYEEKDFYDVLGNNGSLNIVGVILVKNGRIIDYGYINVVSDGKDGKDGENADIDIRDKFPFTIYDRGRWKKGETYYGNKESRDAVWYIDENDVLGAYITNDWSSNDNPNGAIVSTQSNKPGIGDIWIQFQKNFDSVATELLLAENATIAGFSFHRRNEQDLLESQEPQDGPKNLILNGTTGELIANNAQLRGSVSATQFNVLNSNHRDALIFEVWGDDLNNLYPSAGIENGTPVFIARTYDDTGAIKDEYVVNMTKLTGGTSSTFLTKALLLDTSKNATYYANDASYNSGVSILKVVEGGGTKYKINSSNGNDVNGTYVIKQGGSYYYKTSINPIPAGFKSEIILPSSGYTLRVYEFQNGNLKSSNKYCPIINKRTVYGINGNDEYSLSNPSYTFGNTKQSGSNFTNLKFVSTDIFAPYNRVTVSELTKSTNFISNMGDVFEDFSDTPILLT